MHKNVSAAGLCYESFFFAKPIARLWSEEWEWAKKENWEGKWSESRRGKGREKQEEEKSEGKERRA